MSKAGELLKKMSEMDLASDKGIVMDDELFHQDYKSMAKILFSTSKNIADALSKIDGFISRMGGKLDQDELDRLQMAKDHLNLIYSDEPVSNL